MAGLSLHVPPPSPLAASPPTPPATAEALCKTNAETKKKQRKSKDEINETRCYRSMSTFRTWAPNWVTELIYRTRGYRLSSPELTGVVYGGKSTRVRQTRKSQKTVHRYFPSSWRSRFPTRLTPKCRFGTVRGGVLSCYLPRSHSIIDHASLPRRSTVPTPDRDTSNIWAPITFFPYIT